MEHLVQKGLSALSNKMYITFFFFFSFICIQSQNTHEEYSIINSVIEKSHNKIYHKTICSMFNGEKLGTYMEYIEFNLCNAGFNPKEIIITDEERKILSQKFSDLTKVKIDKDLIQNTKKVTRRKKTVNLVHISYPVIFRNGKYAIYYSEVGNGGGFSLLKKENNTWKSICYCMAWIE